VEQPVIKQIVEAVLFASDSPISATKIQGIIDGAKAPEVKKALVELNQEYQVQNRAFEIQEIAGGYQLTTKPEYYKWLINLKTKRQENKLSTAALETLSIIAYKQPLLRAEIENIRGVDSGAIIRALMEKGIVRITGRAETLGRPILYGTTNQFLELIGLASIKDLPKAEEIK